jgi:hypothetical protein
MKQTVRKILSTLLFLIGLLLFIIGTRDFFHYLSPTPLIHHDLPLNEQGAEIQNKLDTMKNALEDVRRVNMWTALIISFAGFVTAYGGLRLFRKGK